jgi:hypothetical protein
LIVAAIFWGDGATDIYRPTVEFPDYASCAKAAGKINTRWHAEGTEGLATCVAADLGGAAPF